MSKNIERDQLTLENLGQGVAGEKFQYSLEKVMENIIDPNTDPMKVRKIELCITIKPSKDRGLLNIKVQSKETLAPDEPSEHHAFTGTDTRGKHIALVDNPNQPSLPGMEDETETPPKLKEVK